MNALKLGHQTAYPTGADGDPGLTKREAFAMAAMQALVTSNDEGAGDRLTEIPEYAVQIADALLAELAKDGDA